MLTTSEVTNHTYLSYLMKLSIDVSLFSHLKQLKKIRIPITVHHKTFFFVLSDLYTNKKTIQIFFIEHELL